MESQAAMLLDPKAYRKRLQSNGNHPASPLLPKDSPDLNLQPSDQMPQALDGDPASTPHRSVDLHSTGQCDLLATGASQQNMNRSPLSSAQQIAPPGTVPVIRSYKTESRNPSMTTTPATSSPARSIAPKADLDLAVQFTSVNDEGNESDAKRSYHDISDVDDARPWNLIEGVYDVEQRRQQQPLVKKQKLEAEASNTAFAKRPVAMSGDSGLGQFMKDGEAKPNPLAAPADVVDLTASVSNDDDDLQVTGSNDLSNQRVCFGKVENAMVNATMVPKPLANPIFGDEANTWPTMRLHILRQPRNDFIMEVADPHKKVFGVIDAKTAQALCPLLDSPKVPLEITARLDMRKKVPGEVVWGATSGIYRASLILYGERRHAALVGNHMGQKNVWLGIPQFVETGVPLFNPHAERRQALAAAAAASNNSRERPGQNMRFEVRTAEEVNDAVMKMFDQLVTADIPSMDPPAQVKTPLLHHQKQALWFMTQKEKPRTFGPKEEDNNSLWRVEIQPNGNKRYKDIISGVVLDQEPPQILGGLLADMMGLGKTLSILALALSSLKESREWTRQMPDRHLVRQNPGIRNTKTTLLVVPLSAVNNWVVQIKEHVRPKTCTYYVYHGTNRITNVDELAAYDFLITTYSTILSEYSGRGAKRGSPLKKMNMFRIVLDEAHIIREQGAQQTKAILNLCSQRRWSVTGTPIQNRLEDLLSVTKFLNLFPYNDRARFGQYILSPFKTGNPTVLASLRVLVDSFTLRRVKDRIDLPPREDKIINLEFSEKEHKLHEFFRNESQVMMRVIAGESKTKMGGRMYHHVLKAMMILRQISAHGKELLDVDERERIKGMSVHDAIDLEEGVTDDSMTAMNKKAYEMFMLMGQDGVPPCQICNNPLSEPLTGSGAVDPDASMAIFLPCWCVLCPDCFAGWKNAFDSTPETEVQCQVCDGWIPMNYATITAGGIEAQQVQASVKKTNKMLGEYEGPHTKTLALVEYLQRTADESKLLVGEPPIKSVIFSAWTSHLDLIEIAVQGKGLGKFVRLDGTMTLQARGKALEAFAKDNEITMLLATIGAGGVGLNLTSASRVFIMEPQYNPAAVAQAVDRVHRLGQHRPVETVQFIMKGSIEEKILELAKKKQQLADMSMNRGKLDKREVQEARMREYRSLFK
jgi:SNF2 family DNA or RNA helicase